MIGALSPLLLSLALAPEGDLPGIEEVDDDTPVVDDDAAVVDADAPPPPPPADEVPDEGDTLVETHDDLDIQMGSTTVVEEDSVGPGEYKNKYLKPVPDQAALERQRTLNFEDKQKGKLYQPPGSKQRFLFEAKFGPYLPDVDRKYTGAGLGPYATVYGKTDDNGVATKQPKLGLGSFLSFEYQFAYVFGAFSVGLQGGFFRDKANALLSEPPADGSVRSEADKTSFALVPLTGLLGYRFSYLADRFKVPIVPYVRGGVGYGFWWSKDGSGKIAVNDAGKASGGVWGWQLNAGGMLRLDWLEAGAMRALDNTTGVNHIALFGEYMISRLDNFGRKGSISVGDATWLVGLAVEF